MEFIRGQIIINVVWILENGGVVCASLGVGGGRWYLMPKGGVGGSGGATQNLIFLWIIRYNIITRCNCARVNLE